MKRSIISVLFFAQLLSGCEKWRLDEQARDLCARDGGLTVYETVMLPAKRFNEYGQTRLPEKSLAKPTDEYFYEWDLAYLRKGNPELMRSHFRLIRRVDGKVLGEAVSYIRRGGDGPIPLPLPDSSFLCPSDGGLNKLAERVFKKLPEGNTSG